MFYCDDTLKGKKKTMKLMIICVFELLKCIVIACYNIILIIKPTSEKTTLT